MPAPDDPLAAELKRIRRRSRWTSSATETALPEANALDSARDVPRLLAAVEAVLELHRKQEKPVRSWDFDLRCPAHDPARAGVIIPKFDVVRDCPDCSWRERHPCMHCQCEDWPCPTVVAITRSLTGGTDETA